MENNKEIPGKYHLVIDKGRIVTAVVVLIMMTLFFVFMLRLANVF
jgi:hypothetical protein